jgi:hypothetical protein
MQRYQVIMRDNDNGEILMQTTHYFRCIAQCIYGIMTMFSTAYVSIVRGKDGEQVIIK